MTAIHITLSPLDLIVGPLLMLLGGLLSMLMGMGMLRGLFIATLRMTVQLFAIGYVILAVLRIESWWLTLSVAMAMALVAGYEVFVRQGGKRFRGFWGYGMGGVLTAATAAIATLFALIVQIQPDPWHSARFALPIFGMMIGNTMTGIALGLELFLDGVSRERSIVEGQLALGATRWEALRPIGKRALHGALTPTMNAMAATGVVAFPGLMAGQIIAGADPIEAAKYQLLIALLFSGATVLGVVLAVGGCTWRCTDERHRLRLDRMTG